MKKTVKFSIMLLSLCVLAFGFFLACEGPMGPPGPQGESGTGGISPPEKGRWPAPESFRTEWNNSPNLPNPFISWHGLTVNADNWAARRAEIMDMMQFYVFGYKLDEPGMTSQIISVGTPSAAGFSAVVVRVTRTNGLTGDFAFSVKYPNFATSPSDPTVGMPATGWPILMNIGGGGANLTATTASYDFSAMHTLGIGSATLHGNTISNGDPGDNENYFYINGIPSTQTPGGMIRTLFPEVTYISGDRRSWGRDDVTARYPTGDGTGTWLDDFGSPDSPGLFMHYAWGVSRIIDALEAEWEKPAANRLVHVNPLAIGVAGASRNGKAAYITGAMDDRIFLTAPAVTCAGGTNIDRFTSIAVNEAHSRMSTSHPDWRESTLMPLNAEQGRTQHTAQISWKPYNYPDNYNSVDYTETPFVPYSNWPSNPTPFDGYGPTNKFFEYFQDLGIGEFGLRHVRVVTAAEALVNPRVMPDGGPNVAFPSGSGNNDRVIWQNGDPTAVDPATLNLRNVKDGYGVHRRTLNHNHAITGFSGANLITDSAYVDAGSPGTFTDATNTTAREGVVANDRNVRAWVGQTWPDHRWRYSSSWGGRFQRMPLIYNHLNIHTRDYAGDWGYFANAPFDTHFIGAMIAPRTLIMTNGFVDNNGAPESTFFGYLAVREVYRLLDAEDQIGLYMALHEHAFPENDVMHVATAFRAALDNNPIPAAYRPNSVETYPYPINDPRSRYDYLKLDWAAPGFTPIADQVKDLVPANATSWSQIGGIPSN